MSVFENINTTHPKLQGALGEAAAVYHLMKMGYCVYKPVCDAGKADFIIEDTNGVLSRVQVKTTRLRAKYKTQPYVVNIATSGGNRKINVRVKREEGDYDYLFVLTESGDCWFIPESALNGAGNSVYLGTNFDQYKIV